MGIRPLNDKVLVKPIDAPETTKGGIIIPDTAAEKPQEGEVIAVGKGRLQADGTIYPLDVKKGDRVLFGKYGSTDIQVKGENYLILDEGAIFAVLES